jgi:hypothetical protein
MNTLQAAVNALFSFGSSALVLLLGWFIGQRLTYSWNVKQKRRELQLSSAQQFYLAYGEFFSVWKLWNRIDRVDAAFSDRRWELHKRAASAEAIIEGTLVKLSSELILTEPQVAVLACFRQAFQQLRQAIRENQVLPWSHGEHPEYRAFEHLAVNTAILLGGEWPGKAPLPSVAADQLLKITSNKWEHTWADNQP